MFRLPKAWPPYAILFIALAATVIVTRYVAETAEAKDRDRFENVLQSTRDDLGARIETYLNVLVSGAALFAATEHVTREDFHSFVERIDLADRYPGIQGVGYSHRIPTGQEAEVERWMRAQGVPDFRVWPEGDRPEKHAILFLEPLDRRNLAAIGYDMFSEAVRHEAMKRARDSGRPAVSGRVTLVQEIEQEKQSGFLIYVPVYAKGKPTRTTAERREALEGFVYSPFRGNDLLAGIFGSQKRPRVDIEIYDGESIDATRLLGRSGPKRSPAPLFETQVPVNVAGRTWTLRLISTPAFERASQRTLTPIVAGCGVAVTLFLFGVAWLQWRAREAAERFAEELRQSEHALREANRSKDEFLAMLGHELRNPLGAISNAVQILRRSQPGEAAFDRALEVVARQVRLQNRLLADVLDVSRVTSGRLQIERHVLDLGELVRNVVQAHRATSEREGHELVVTTTAESLLVAGDPARLDQVVSNLLSNAIKYTPPRGHIRVAVVQEDGRAVVRVRDDGIGMSAELQARVFDAFVQGDRSLDRSQGGLGLGLTLVRRIVEMHDGTVTGSSAGIGQGSEFTIRLPLAEPSSLVASARRPVVESEDGCAGRRVLVIEDMEDARVSLADILTEWGCSVSVAPDGPRGLRLARERTPDVALVDIGLPGMNGYEVARQLRQSVAGRKIRLVAVTGYGQPADRIAALEAGFDFHLVKPLDEDELRRLVGES